MTLLTPLVPERNKEHVRKAVSQSSRDVRGGAFKYAILATLLFSLLILAVLLIDVVAKSWDQLGTRPLEFLEGVLRSLSDDDRLGVHQGLYGSFWIAVFTALLAFPLGIFAAVYLEEYAADNRFTRFLQLVIRNLAGVPSVVYGLLGLYLFVDNQWISDNITGGRTVVSAGLTLAILVLPIVIITSAEALRSVPSGLKEGAYGVGATKWDMIRTQMLPYAAPGILTGTLLSMSRAIGEAAPLILIGAVSGGMTLNPSIWDASSLQERFTAMPILITTWTQNSGRDPGFQTAAAAAIVVLLVFVLLLNMAAILLRNRFENRRTV